MEEYCQNPLCANKAAKEVLVSVEAPGDQARLLCAACEEVYTWGVQHGGRIDHGLRIDPPGEEMGPEPLYIPCGQFCSSSIPKADAQQWICLKMM